MDNTHFFIDKCPEEWVYVEGSASKCFRYFSKRETWSIASEKCQEIGGELATIDTKADNEYIFFMFWFCKAFLLVLSEIIVFQVYFLSKKKSDIQSSICL